MRPARVIKLTPKQVRDLELIVARPSSPAGLVRRARVVLLSAAGEPGVAIAAKLDLSPEQVSRIRRRFVETGVDGLPDRPRPGRTSHMISDERVNRLLALALSPPPAGRVRWTSRLLGKEIGTSASCAAEILRRHDLKPHRLRTYKVSQDPEFASKMRDVVGLYLNPPEHAVVLSVDEKTQIQALERTQPPLPLRSGRAVRHTHDYKRHGVVDLYAALEVATGHVTHQLTDSHTAADFLGFMRKVVRVYPERELHVVLDNSSTHSTPDVKRWLEAHPKVHFHYTPTSASWLNQVEGFFGILGKQSLAVSDHVSKKALREHIEAFLRSWNRNPTPFVWTKSAHAIVRSHKRMLELTSNTMH